MKKSIKHHLYNINIFIYLFKFTECIFLFLNVYNEEKFNILNLITWNFMKMKCSQKEKNIYCIENYLEMNYVNCVNLNKETCYYYDSLRGKLP